MSLRRRLTRTVAADSETLLAARERRAACAPIFSDSVEALTPFLAHRWHWSFAFPRAPCVFDEELRAFNLMHALHALTSAPLRRTAGGLLCAAVEAGVREEKVRGLRARGATEGR